MKKLLILFIISLIGEFATGIYMVQKMSALDSTSTPASEFANTMSMPMILCAIWAVLFWVSLIGMTYLVVKKILSKNK